MKLVLQERRLVCGKIGIAVTGRSPQKKLSS